MNEEKDLKTLLTFAGILVLLAIPVYLAIKKRRSGGLDEEPGIFAAELEE